MGKFLPEIKIGYAVRGERGEEFCKKHNKTANPLHPTSVWKLSAYCYVYIFLSAEKENAWSRGDTVRRN